MKSSTQFYAPRNEVILLLLETGERFSFQLCASSDPGLPPKLSSLPPYTIDFFNFIENEAVDAVVQSGSRYSTLYDVYRNLKDVLICSIGSIKNGVLMESQLFTRTGSFRHPFKLVLAKLKRKCEGVRGSKGHSLGHIIQSSFIQSMRNGCLNEVSD